MKSRKILVPIELNIPQTVINEVLYLRYKNGKFVLTGSQTENEYDYGMVVIKGGGITEIDLFALVVDSGAKIDSVEFLQNSLIEYLEEVKNFKIGNIIKINDSIQSNKISLIKYLNRTSSKV